MSKSLERRANKVLVSLKEISEELAIMTETVDDVVSDTYQEGYQDGYDDRDEELEDEEAEQ